MSRITTAMTPTATQSPILKEKQKERPTNTKNTRSGRRNAKGSKKEVSRYLLLKSLKKRRLLAKKVRKTKEQRTTSLSRD